MKTIKVIENVTHNGILYSKGQEIEPTKENIEVIDLLNVNGFIEPLSVIEFIELKKELNKPKKNIKIEED